MADVCDSRDGYNFFEQFPNYSYLMVKYLRDNNETIWKLLKYNSANAWMKPDLTVSEKNELIYDGIGNSSKFSIFLSPGFPDVGKEEKTFLTISPNMIIPTNKVVSQVTIMCEVYSNFNITHLSNYTARVDVIAQQLIQTFNGAIIDGLGIGQIFLDRLGSKPTGSERAGTLPFSGRWLLFANNTV